MYRDVENELESFLLKFSDLFFRFPIIRPPCRCDGSINQHPLSTPEKNSFLGGVLKIEFVLLR